MYQVKNYITIDKDVVSGAPVFKGTRIPIQIMFDYLRDGELNEFLSDFPSVSKKHARAVIAIAARIVTARNVAKLYETAIR